VTDPAESVIRKFLGSFPASDVEDVIGFFSDDAVYIDGPRGVHRGIDAIRTELQSQFAMVSYAAADNPSTRPGDRLGCAAYGPSWPVAVCAGRWRPGATGAVGGQGGHRVHKPTLATTHGANCSPG
jgi:hypothetical protein